MGISRRYKKISKIIQLLYKQDQRERLVERQISDYDDRIRFEWSILISNNVDIDMLSARDCYRLSVLLHHGHLPIYSAVTLSRLALTKGGYSNVACLHQYKSVIDRRLLLRVGYQVFGTQYRQAELVKGEFVLFKNRPQKAKQTFIMRSASSSRLATISKG